MSVTFCSFHLHGLSCAKRKGSLDPEEGSIRLLQNISDYHLPWYHIPDDFNLMYLLLPRNQNAPKFEATQRLMHKCPEAVQTI
jgi:hypothetical protein